MSIFKLVRKAAHLALLFTGVVFFFSSAAYAQSGAGSIQGTVTDSTGAVIPNAQIHVVRIATKVTTDTTSNGTGFYEVPALLVGTYRITVTAPGMKTYQTSLELLVAQNAVINPMMQAGSVSQTVEVNADTVQLTTNDGPQVESTLENQRIQQLPENGRNIEYLLNMAVPGIENNGTAANGSDPEAIALIVDGAPTNNNNGGGNPNLRTENIDPDAVQEVRVELNNSGAQYSSPTTEIVATKSGTNQLHGTFFETARNNAFGVAQRRETAPGSVTPQLIRNEFGLSAGGPLWIPKVYDGHDKTFWFFAYERYSLAQNGATLTAVPTVAFRNGDFSQLTNGTGVGQTLYDPANTYSTMNCPDLTTAYGKVTASTACRNPFPGNVIPQSEESPLAKVYGDITPLPNTSDNPIVHPNLYSHSIIYQTVPQITARLDHTFDQSNKGFVRFTHEQSQINQTGGPPNVAADGIPAGAAFGYSNNPTNHYNAAISYTHIFSPTFFAETVVSSQWFTNATLPGTNINTNYEQLLNLPNNFGEVGFPSITGQLVGLGSSQSGNSKQVQINSLLDENLTKVWGHHQILFGGRITHTRQSNVPNGIADLITFGANSVALYDTGTGTNWTGLPNTGNANAGFFLGSAGGYTVNLEAPRVSYHQWGEALYVQDNFHVRDNLTLNVGLRYEAHPALWTDNGLMNSFDLKNDAMVLASTTDQLIARKYTTQAIITNDKNLGMIFETPQEAGLPANTLLKSYDFNLLPRMGVAYTLNRSRWSPVIRGGYGMYLSDTPLQDFANHPENNNPLTASYTQSFSSAAQAVDNLPNELLRYNAPVKFGVAGKNTAGVVNSNTTNSLTPGPSTAIWSDSPDWRPIRYQQGNVTVELPLPWRSALRVSYVYQKTTNLDVSVAYNNSPTTYQWESQTGLALPTGPTSVVATNPYDNTTYGGNTYHTKDGWKVYNGLQMNYQRLYHNGSAFQISYVFAKAMTAGGDNGSTSADNTESNVYPYANFPGGIGASGVVTSPYGTYLPGVADPKPAANQPEYVVNHEQIKFQLYQLDTSVPVHHVKFNGIYDLPIGRGKAFFSNTPKWLNEIIGGFQIAGDGQVISQLFQPGTGNWGPTNPVQIYKKKYPVTNCTSGSNSCYKEFLWWNGYIAPQNNPTDPNYNGSIVTGATAACQVKGTCITGVPTSVKPFQTPVDNVPGTAQYGANTVAITLLNAKTVTSPFDAGPTGTNFARKRYFAGPMNWTADASLFKVFPIKGTMNLRVNLDAFNVFNMPGENNPAANGTEDYSKSHNDPRQLQITARFTF
jgi:hypothetical protein